MKKIKYEMMETMMQYIKKKEEIANRPSGKRIRHIAEQNCYKEFIDILYKWIMEIGDDEPIENDADKPLTQHQIEQQQRIAENAGKNPF